MPFSFGGGSSSSESGGEVWDVQARHLARLYRNAANLVQQQQGNIFGYAEGLSNEALGLFGDAEQTFRSIIEGTSPGMSYMRSRIGEANPYLEETIGNYGEDIARNLAQNILPELRSGGVAAGAPGGSRFHLAQGAAADTAQREFSRGAAQMRYQDVMQRDALAGSIDQMMMGAGGGMAELAQPLYNLGMSPYQAPWMPLLNMASIVGQPTVLNRSESDDTSFSFGF